MVVFGRAEKGADVVVSVLLDIIGKSFAFLIGTHTRLVFVAVIKISTLHTEFQFDSP